MSEGRLAHPAQHPTALRPSAPGDGAVVPASVPAAPQPLLGNAATARATAGGGRTPDQPGPATVSHTGSPADTAVAGQLADGVYAALNWLNEDQRAPAALRGHGPAMRALI